MTGSRAQPLLSVVVKCLNEEANLERCLRSLASKIHDGQYEAEIILADSISTDRSVEIARQFEVTIVQLANPADRRCGAAGHLGWQFVRGQFLLQVDGDHELLPGFLEAALAAMRGDDRLGAVGGRVDEMSEGIEWRERQSRPNPARRPGLVDHVPSCGLYRTAAIREAGHFMDRNLHCFEEFELGLRLRAKGWRLRMLDMACVRHYGYRDSSFKLLIRRWRTRFLFGYGELLRGAWGQPYFRQALWPCRLALAVVLWWGLLLALAAMAALAALSHHAYGRVVMLLIATAALPCIAMLLRKRNVERATYALLMHQFSAAALLAGLFAARIAPATPLAATVVRDPRTQKQGCSDHQGAGHHGAGAR